MAIFSLALRTAASASSTATHEIIAGANNAFKLLEFGVMVGTGGVANVLGFGVPAAVGTAPTSPVTFLAEDAGNTTTGATSGASAWTTPPTTPSAYYRRVSLPGTFGGGIIWTFPRGLVILKTKTLATWNVGSGVMSVCDIWAVVDE